MEFITIGLRRAAQLASKSITTHYFVTQFVAHFPTLFRDKTVMFRLLSLSFLTFLFYLLLAAKLLGSALLCLLLHSLAFRLAFVCFSLLLV